MLLAEIHAHVVPEALSSEDYLTSAIFGHLRYLPPAIFWPELFGLAVNLPLTGNAENLTSVLASRGINIGCFETLKAHFWPPHPTYGVPDLLLCFTGCGQNQLAILIEAKLTAEKSGTGEHDQLARYLKLLDAGDGFGSRLQSGCQTFVLYLTERDSVAEVEESIEVCSNTENARARIFRLCWQDIIIAAKQVNTVGFPALILKDVISLLKIRGLEYFNGFHRLQLPELRADFGNFYSRSPFRRIPMPHNFTVQKGAWVHE